ncbi:MAG: S8 family serine peptidase [Eubacteriales bacterium]|nr:S8 family serine peptidase [Eubacteriales bacterium]
MYDSKQRSWIGGELDKTQESWCRDPSNRQNPEAQYLLADRMLADLTDGERIADAVFLMESAAKADHPDAAYAMGQMFEHGWAVGKNRKTAQMWYEKAASLGQKQATEDLQRMRRERRRTILLSCAGAAVILAVIAAAAGGIFQKPIGVLVHKDTELRETTTMEEFSRAVKEVVAENDDELVITGARKSNRLILKFEGDTIDLRRFPAATVVANENNLVIIQFKTEEEAEECLQALREMDSVIFIMEDSYRKYQPDSSTGPALRDAPAGSSRTEKSLVQKTHSDTIFCRSAPNGRNSDYTYHSPYTGEDYYSWGIETMGYDKLAAWIKHDVQTEPVVTAVIDTGTVPCEETKDRVLPGYSPFSEDGKGWDVSPYYEMNYHGTHVAGTILDCTRGLDVSILPIRNQIKDEEILAQLGDEPSVSDFLLMSHLVNITCLYYALEQNADVINMSWAWDLSTMTDDDLNAYNSCLEDIVSKGVVCVVAAGNKTANTSGSWPPCTEKCIVVGALGPDGTIASFSNYGDTVDVCAPGVEIRSNVPKGYIFTLEDLDFDREADVINQYPDAYLADLSGTSMAAPHIAALAAILKLYHHDRTPAQIEQYIKDYCNALGDPAHYGEGLPIAAMFAEDDIAPEEENPEFPGEDEDYRENTGEGTTVEPPSEEEIQVRKDDSGAQSGEIEITLLWDTVDDLDLHCITPNGSHIYYKNMNTGGGKLDVDRNRTGTSFVTDPIEHIFFENPVNGQYRVFVKDYEDRTDAQNAHATVQVEISGTVETYEAVFNTTGEKKDIVTFEYNGGTP